MSNNSRQSCALRDTACRAMTITRDQAQIMYCAGTNRIYCEGKLLWKPKTFLFVMLVYLFSNDTLFLLKSQLKPAT